MITFVRTADIASGDKFKEAYAWALQVAKYIDDHFEGIDIHVARNIGGPLYQLHWVSTVDSLAKFEAVMQKIEGDAGYQELLAKGRQQGLFVPSSLVDRLYQTVS